MNRPRIERAIKVIEALIADEVETVENFHNRGEQPTGNVFEIGSWGQWYSCKTVACLGGWMTLDRELRTSGLRNVRDFTEGSSLEPAYNCVFATDALAQFFELSIDETFYIFNGGNPNSLEKGLSRVKRVARGEYDPEERYWDQYDDGNEPAGVLS